MDDRKTVVALAGGGRRFRLDLAELPELTCGETMEPGEKPIAYFNPQQEFKCSFKLQRISRKRFVNNMRSIGYTKKQAKKLAREVKTSYAAAWMMAGFGITGEKSLHGKD